MFPHAPPIPKLFAYRQSGIQLIRAPQEIDPTSVAFSVEQIEGFVDIELGMIVNHLASNRTGDQRPDGMLEGRPNLNKTVSGSPYKPEPEIPWLAFGSLKVERRSRLCYSTG